MIFEILAFVSDADVLGMPKFIRSTINKMSSANCGNDAKSNNFCPLKLWLKDLIKLHIFTVEFFSGRMWASAGHLLWIYRQLIGMSYIALARHVQIYRNISDPVGRLGS